MNHSIAVRISMCLGLVIAIGSSCHGQVKEENTVRESIAVLNEIMSIPVDGIPRQMFNDAQAVAIIPGVIKGSFVVGARRGNGVVMIRDENGGWHAPVFITLTGGNIGWQVGVQSTDVVLVFKTRKSVNGLLSGRFTLGADAAVAAGPVGRQAAAATDTNLGAQIYSYSRSRGLFAGVSFDGSVIRVDPMSNAAYYRPTTPGGPVAIPASAQQLGAQVIRYAGNQVNTPNQAAVQPSPAGQTPASQIPARLTSSPHTGQWRLPHQHTAQEADELRDQLARLAPEMYELLDANWQQYLGLPAQVFRNGEHPNLADLNQSLAHFEAVRTDPRYAALANNPAFESTYGLLKHYMQSLSASQSTLNLPAPPAGFREVGGIR